MGSNLNKALDSLSLIVNRYGVEDNSKKIELLKRISKIKLPLNETIHTYNELLLFICAFPNDAKILALAERELKRISLLLKSAKNLPAEIFNNSGLPFTAVLTGFSHDCIQWLLSHPDIAIKLSSFESPAFDLNEVLRLTLPSLEKSETTAGFTNFELLDALLVKEKDRLPFLISELGKLNQLPYVKDHLFEGLGAYVELAPKNKSFSKSYNRIQIDSVFYHDQILKRFDHEALLNASLPKTKVYARKEIDAAILAVKNSMAIYERETDPITYMDERSFSLYELERGVTVAIYGMIPERQLPLESYVGFTLFKNGLPAAYGGAWIFGEYANFGINIFESFRGGESGYMMCQLLRVYKQVFKISFFEVEAYQFGLDNPDGIKTGAFWFYYRYGFRPIDAKLKKIAKDESVKIANRKNYHTSKKVLIQFTESNMGLQLAGKKIVSLYEISEKVKQLIQKQYKGNRVLAEKDSVMRFKIKTLWAKNLNANEEKVLKEVALWAEAMQINDSGKLDLMCQMIKTKPIDLYKYQLLLLNFFQEK